VQDGEVTEYRIRKSQILRFPIPDKFSFIEDPDLAMRTINALRMHLAAGFVEEIHFDHRDCEHLGLCAQAVLDSVLMERSKRRTLMVGGSYSKNAEVKLMQRAIGTLRTIRHPDMNLSEEDEHRIVRSDLYTGRGHKPEQSKERDEAGTMLVDYFNRALGKQGYELSGDSLEELSKLITEVIGNAEEHGGRWYTVAYFRQFPKKDGGECHIAIFNFGKTIYESLSSPSASKVSKGVLEKREAHHRAKGYLNSDWDEEALWTVGALQQRISRYRDAAQGRDRGNGTIQMIQAFSTLASRPEKMCIVSGKTYILYDGTFDLEDQPLPDGGSAKVIAFNPDNDLDLPPDKKFVKKLEIGFPGTLISLKFPLEESHLDEIAEKESK